MKSVLISIQPKWCELIASGKKTVEVRKTRPKLETPFKCYIYCTKGDWLTSVNGKVQKPNCMAIDLSTYNKTEDLNGKVIGEFVCDEIGTYYPIYGEVNPYSAILESYGCLTAEEIRKYISTRKRRSYGLNKIYGWHISDLVIYDKPRELGEFSKYGFDHPVWLKRPFQSWGYVYEADT